MSLIYFGVATVETNSVRKENGFDGNLTYGNVNIGASQRNLINPDELIKLNNDKLIIIVRGKKPLQAFKFDYSEHELSNEMEEIVVEEYKEKLNVERIIQSEIDKQKQEEHKIEKLPTFEEFLKGKGGNKFDRRT